MISQDLYGIAGSLQEGAPFCKGHLDGQKQFVLGIIVVLCRHHVLGVVDTGM